MTLLRKDEDQGSSCSADISASDSGRGTSEEGDNSTLSPSAHGSKGIKNRSFALKSLSLFRLVFMNISAAVIHFKCKVWQAPVWVTSVFSITE